MVDHMVDHQKNELALLRYRIILPIVQNHYPDASQHQYMKKVSQEAVTFPDGKRKYIAPATIKAWLSQYRKYGFDGLVTRKRSDRGMSRSLSTDVKERIFALKQARPRKTAKSIYDELIEESILSAKDCSLATVQRYVARIRHQIHAPFIEDMKAFEMEFANDLWQIDTSQGPYLTLDGKRCKTYMIMIIDDASRMIVGYDIFLRDNAVNVQLVIKKAIAMYGVPKRIYTDNGTPYKNQQLELICAGLGIGLNRTAPYHGNQKGKIERNFKSVKEGWMYNIDTDHYHSVARLCESLGEYVNQKNNMKHASLSSTPWLRFLQDQDHIKRIAQEVLHQAFLHTVTRKVANDATIRLLCEVFETTLDYIGRNVQVKYAPDLSSVFIVDEEFTPPKWMPLKKVNKVENARVKRRQPLLSEVY
jgi:putative transposase